MHNAVRLFLGTAALALAGCAPGTDAQPRDEAPAPAAAEPPYMPIASVLELMEGPIAHAAEVYWNSVAIIVDADGEHEHYPTTDEEWEQVWAAALTVAESGNLLMMAPRAVDDGAWMQFARSLVTAGKEAADVALARDTDGVFTAGEAVYNVCTGCHLQYVPQEAPPQ